MSRRRTSAALAPVPVQSTSPRFVLRRYAEDPTPPDLVASIEDALGNGLAVTFFICRDDGTPLFELRPFRGVVHVMGWRGDHLATCAMVETALSRAWEYADPVRPKAATRSKRRV
ncbi:hypothetical protein D3273_13455 [Lichenibacterium minor]|uniref:Uncharacterized protein n=1 Tax=Lichenibacterium minor TaxID=2316528 RepID=A0A4Q2U527_9HYPH|nr:hypothetical protein [Lichenibacterium minor]RYC31390.1 hypothetical protein D3273_13455 [Lichenibacterium minor]